LAQLFFTLILAMEYKIYLVPSRPQCFIAALLRGSQNIGEQVANLFPRNKT
jgi:hypothetical protein